MVLPPVKGPIVVHCSAGIGRSGSFMAIASIMSRPLFNQLMYDSAYTKSDKDRLLSVLSTSFSIPDIVLSFRQKRHPSIVQTQQQYNFIYTALIDELCHPTTFSEGLRKVIQWKIIARKKRLSQSWPNLKSNRENYLQFLRDHTSNDLKYIFLRGDQNNTNNEKEIIMNQSTLNGESKNEKLFLCKSWEII